MKKTVLLMGIIALLLSGCATATSMNGILYTGVTEPINATGSEKGTHAVGKASCINVLGLVAAGNCSIDAAARKAGIKVIKSVDRKRTSVLGLFLKETTIVTGE